VRSHVLFETALLISLVRAHRAKVLYLPLASLPLLLLPSATAAHPVARRLGARALSFSHGESRHADRFYNNDIRVISDERDFCNK
jgi:hypothetical protein